MGPGAQGRDLGWEYNWEVIRALDGQLHRTHTYGKVNNWALGTDSTYLSFKRQSEERSQKDIHFPPNQDVCLNDPNPVLGIWQD